MMMMWFDGCESLTDSSVPEIFFPFGRDEGDSVVPVGDDYCAGPINIPYEMFSHDTIYVRSTCSKHNKTEHISSSHIKSSISRRKYN